MEAVFQLGALTTESDKRIPRQCVGEAGSKHTVLLPFITYAGSRQQAAASLRTGLPTTHAFQALDCPRHSRL